MHGRKIVLVLVTVGILLAIWAWLQLTRQAPRASDQEIGKGSSTVVTAAAQEEAAALLRRLDPARSGWETEAQTENITDQLTALLAMFSEGNALDPASLRSYALEDVTTSPLRPPALTQIYHDDAVTVRQAEGPIHESMSGLQALGHAFLTLVEPLVALGEVHLKTKIIGIDVQDQAAETTVLFEGRGLGQTSGAFQIRARWKCLWSLSGNEDPRLSKITCERYQEASTAAATWFAEGTPDVLGHTAAFHQQLSYGLHYWLKRIERTHGMLYFHRHGLAVGDVNGDGRDDVYVCQAGGLPNRLFIQNPDGTASDVSREAGVDWLDNTSSALWVDLDNDGDQDLVLATFEGVFVLEQDAPLHFTLRAHLETGDTDLQSLSAVDVDSDGKLDLYLCVDFADPASGSGGNAASFVYHDANDGGANRLWQNAITGPEDWHFTDITAASGLDRHQRRHSLAAAWEDVDNDGDQDLYVANDYGQNCLYVNDDGHFEEKASQLGVVDYGSGMSVSWADADRDGRMDLYVGNMFSSAGSRLTEQAAFLEQASVETRALYPRFAKGNTLFLQGDDGFQEVSETAGVGMGRWAWSSLFADVNNDGWEDLLVANGYITTEDSGDL